ncbi:LysR substrate-binding domain-containing protein [Chelativorans sp. J32]|uniref:LysR substrate-binding domain-containing protein n=1 Tax=Chelativorans sp. J32 TaxID=935840 RepID=UPI00047F7923|nr:LysR substrate-binding domain-containing protein [Chelativorans sp. J32]
MELKQLKYLLSVSELGSFSKAAVVLSVAQPVLSRHIRSLEEELGVELLHRTGRGIVVSDAGKVVVDHARSIMASIGAISADIDTLRSDPSGRISIGMPPTAGSVLTAPLIERFHEEYPRIRLKVQEGYSGHVLEWLSTGRIDVAILYNAPKTSTLMTEPLIEEELLLVGPGRERCMAMNGPVSGEQLAELPLILPSHPHGLRVLVESLLGARKIYPNVEYEIDSLSAVVNMVERGVGYTILPYASVNSKVEDGALRVTSIIEPRMTRHLVLATSTQRPVTNATRMLAKMVTQLVRDLVREGVWLPRVSTADQYHASTSSIPAIP